MEQYCRTHQARNIALPLAEIPANQSRKSVRHSPRAKGHAVLPRRWCTVGTRKRAGLCRDALGGGRVVRFHSPQSVDCCTSHANLLKVPCHGFPVTGYEVHAQSRRIWLVHEVPLGARWRRVEGPMAKRIWGSIFPRHLRCRRGDGVVLLWLGTTNYKILIPQFSAFRVGSLVHL